MRSTEDLSDPVRLRALELAMREVLGGMEELSLAVAYAHVDYALQIVTDAGRPDETTPRPQPAEVIPFPRLRRAAG